AQRRRSQDDGDEPGKNRDVPLFHADKRRPHCASGVTTSRKGGGEIVAKLRQRATQCSASRSRIAEGSASGRRRQGRWRGRWRASTWPALPFRTPPDIVMKSTIVMGSLSHDLRH